MAALSVDGTPMPALPNSADQINYDNTTSGLSATTVKGAVDELASEKQDKSDNSLQTTNKTIVGGINELKSGLTNLEKNASGTEVNITSYTELNKFVIPSDGYVTIRAHTSTNGYIDARVIGSNEAGCVYFYVVEPINTLMYSVFVKKGMKAYVLTNTTDDSALYYRPLQ